MLSVLRSILRGLNKSRTLVAVCSSTTMFWLMEAVFKRWSGSSLPLPFATLWASIFACARFQEVAWSTDYLLEVSRTYQPTRGFRHKPPQPKQAWRKNSDLTTNVDKHCKICWYFLGVKTILLGVLVHVTWRIAGLVLQDILLLWTNTTDAKFMHLELASRQPPGAPASPCGAKGLWQETVDELEQYNIYGRQRMNYVQGI